MQFTIIGNPENRRVKGFCETVHQLQRHGLHKVFIKPAHASSASGVIAFRKTGYEAQLRAMIKKHEQAAIC